ncbi:MAG: pentapeptide repeat-containing protein [Bradymonadia bacterium]
MTHKPADASAPDEPAPPTLTWPQVLSELARTGRVEGAIITRALPRPDLSDEETATRSMRGPKAGLTPQPAAGSAQSPDTSAEASEPAQGPRHRSKKARRAAADKARHAAETEEKKALKAAQHPEPPPGPPQFNRPAVLKRCVIEGVADFSGLTFEHDIDFDGCHFKNKVHFKGCTFKGQALFRRVTFDQGADFIGGVFENNVHFNSAKFKRYGAFQQTHFKGRVVISQAVFSTGANFIEATFDAKASFNGIQCDHRLQCGKVKFLGGCTFSGARLAEVADFNEVVFGDDGAFKSTQFVKRAQFKKAVFKKGAQFRGAQSQGDAVFEKTRFEGVIDLVSMHSERNVTFEGAEFGDEAFFAIHHAHFRRLLIRREQIEGRLESVRTGDFETARREFGLLKNCWRDNSDYTQEDWAYLMEKRMERLKLPTDTPMQMVRRAMNWLFLDLACGYGTKPKSIALTSLGILMAFAVLFWANPSQFQGGKITLGQSIQLSFRTFTNAEVDSAQPLVDTWLNYLIMVESFTGVFVMLVLVVTFSRKVIR